MTVTVADAFDDRRRTVADLRTAECFHFRPVYVSEYLRRVAQLPIGNTLPGSHSDPAEWKQSRHSRDSARALSLLIMQHARD